MTLLSDPTQKYEVQTPAFWPGVLQSLKGQTTAGIYDQLIKPLVVECVEAGVLHLSTPNPGARALEAQWKPRILAAIPDAEGIGDVAFETRQAAWICAEEPAIPVALPDDTRLPYDDTLPEPSALTPDGGSDEYIGVYHNVDNAIIQPDHREWGATQYYCKHWRPLLGPTLSELIRELRRRCHYRSSRHSFKTTYKSLAEAIGVSERTVKRALERDTAGQFKNAYLGYFIAKMVLVQFRGDDGKTRCEGTRFYVYLDDALTPEDGANPPTCQIVPLVG